MGKLGINFAEIGSRGLLIYVRLSVLSSAEEVMDIVSDIVVKERPKIVVIDSINIILDFLEIRKIRGVLITVAEIPFSIV
ncbi:MAG: hypothetical protein QXM55_04900 [Ignisphaera sp.]